MSKSTPLAVVILAAGKGTRMRSDTPKVMHKVLGLPMVNWVLNTVSCLNPDRTIVVIGEGMDALAASVAPHEYVIQNTQQGTGDALKAALPALKGFSGNVLVLLGDMPLLSPDSLEKLVIIRNMDGVTGISVLGAQVEDPFGFGRLLLNEDGTLKAIREEKDASEEEKQTNIINLGAFCLDSRRVERWLLNLNNKNAQKEYYITGLPEMAAKDNVKTRIALIDDPREAYGCNTRMQLTKLEITAQEMMRESFIEDGVMMQDPSSVYLHYDTQIGPDTVIEPNIYFGSGVVVGSNVHIKAFCHFEDAVIGDGTTIGPFARLRPGARIGQDVRIGNFVEIKKSTIGDRSKINHLGYVGDAIIGTDVNFSCGAITVNYDGFEKHQTIIGNGVMVGSNVNLVAPVALDDGAFVAAGSTVTKDVPADSLSVERSPVKVHRGWAALYRKRKGNKK
ncbi:MAG: bifunctional UDP-N-acetylglucosamine diphosphorylase/glucosamine-1-phosphate N-acetyltransferase GlmU [Alphaproteobacteria bacterium]|nr:bifunctional UDP-N-acetylglucosamine diphosphorylase/glucosamine-1-phosphate N-acetyltransferase GlmU [Alphaproteobacteria bacterium]